MGTKLLILAQENRAIRAASKSRLSGDGAQIFAEGIPVDCWRELLDLVVCLLPDRKGTGEERPSFFGEHKDAAAAIFGIAFDFK